jgi:MFS family permease
MGIAMIVGRILTGFLQDRFSPLPVFGFSILIVLVSCVALRFFNGEVGMGLVASICLGLGTGGTTIGLANLTSRYFGLAAYPSIFGLLMGGFSLGYGIAPVVAGHFREVTASYVPIFDWLTAALVIAVILTWLIGKPGMTLRAA